MGNLEQRVRNALYDARKLQDGPTDWKALARAAITAVREWDKEQASAAVRAEHEGNRTIAGPYSPKCNACGELIDLQVGAIASTGGQHWHFGCYPGKEHGKLKIVDAEPVVFEDGDHDPI